MSLDRSSRLYAPGRMLRFIRYVGTRDGWVPEILHGRFIHGTETGWLVDVDGTQHDLAESEWAPYQP